MKLQDFKFPETFGFSGANTIPELLKEAKTRGFYDGNTPYNKAFSNLFFNGGKVEFKKGIDEEFKKKAWGYCRALMSSWNPKHEEKEAICAMLMSELIEPKIQPKESVYKQT